jgi:hypothetical protein
MLQIHFRYIVILYLCVGGGLPAAQTNARDLSHESSVVARSGGYELTEQMIEQALRFGQFLAGANFSLSDTAALRADLIAIFQKEAAKQMESHAAIAKSLREAPSLRRNPSWLAAAIDRYKAW